ncbi:Glu/Leu/Phe/Val family dehydrogenase [Rhizorhapis suberifaciens]|uniref:Leucine dehydrogenase n=1 Tax=Rhizorhapis suberifaciens TaxID=13656 RepID=A0A840HXC9_9SPHN|nr:Glu/Leu/Phe/Val dehydrogenase [Rhizorhapis suberifaciens]MBB4642054.1 leucine dehydrogenase [Rhizorhapis suberifaciens]
MPALWDMTDFDDHEGVHLFSDPKSRLSAVIAIHSTALGPAAGGVRFWHYSDKNAAITDALRLSRGMSFKNAMAGLPMGGGKGVILASKDLKKTPELLAAFAKAVESLGGRYVTAQDVGMSEADMIALSHGTSYVSGLPPENGGAGGDPGPSTAYGVFLGVKAAIQYRLGADTAKDVHIAIQGVGSVGAGLARYLAKEGAKLTITDVNSERAKALAGEIGAATVAPDQIMQTNADVFSPNALGAILNEDSIGKLKAGIIAGGANNQLATRTDGDRVLSRGLLYAPDYVINAGGIINVALEYLGQGDRVEVNSRIEQIPARLTRIWQESERCGLPASEVADALAKKLIGRG